MVEEYEVASDEGQSRALRQNEFGRVIGDQRTINTNMTTSNTCNKGLLRHL
jgi:hypothetical protein